MIKRSSEYRDSITYAVSQQSSNPNELWQGEFDFALVGVSWDRRCLAFTNCADLSLNTTVIVCPFESTATELLSEHKEVVKEFSKSHSKVVHTIDSKPSQLSETFNDIRSFLRNEICQVDRTRPARIFIDISTCPRFFTLGIMAEALRSGLVSEVVLAYSEGIYPTAAPSYNGLEELSFRDGAFQSIPISGFFGEFEPSKGKFFLVSLGFDGWKTLNLLIRKEPERVTTLLASTREDYTNELRSLAANAALIERFAIFDERMVKATPGDAIEAWQKITEANLEDFENENVYYLCSGNKPHSVALALRAMSLGTPALLYNQADEHLPINIECNGTFWSYIIKPTSGTVLG